jgi:hypothetical protein
MIESEFDVLLVSEANAMTVRPTNTTLHLHVPHTLLFIIRFLKLPRYSKGT